MAVTFTEELVKPLKGLIDTQYKVRKSVEGMVDKTAKNLAEWRSAEAKAKKMSYQCARENEKAEELALDVRLGRGKQLSDKEISKVRGAGVEVGEEADRRAGLVGLGYVERVVMTRDIGCEQCAWLCCVSSCSVMRRAARGCGIMFCKGIVYK